MGCGTLTSPFLAFFYLILQSKKSFFPWIKKPPQKAT